MYVCRSLHWGMVASRLEADIYYFMVSCTKGQRGEGERFTLPRLCPSASLQTEVSV